MDSSERHTGEQPNDEGATEVHGFTTALVDDDIEDDPPWVIRLHQAPPTGFNVRLASDVKVTGVQRRRKDVEAFVSGSDQRIILQREPDNPADPNAIRVVGTWLEADGRERAAVLGYIPRSEAAMIAQEAPNKPLAATIEKMFLPREEKSPGLRIDIWTVGDEAQSKVAAAAAPVPPRESSTKHSTDSDSRDTPGCGCCGCLTLLAIFALIIILSS